MIETRAYFAQIGGIDVAGWEILLVGGVSDDGQTFAGWARNPQDQLVACLATVPEPHMRNTLLIGAAALASSARRRACASGDRPESPLPMPRP